MIRQILDPRMSQTPQILRLLNSPVHTRESLGSQTNFLQKRSKLYAFPPKKILWNSTLGVTPKQIWKRSKLVAIWITVQKQWEKRKLKETEQEGMSRNRKKCSPATGKTKSLDLDDQLTTTSSYRWRAEEKKAKNAGKWTAEIKPREGEQSRTERC